MISGKFFAGFPTRARGNLWNAYVAIFLGVFIVSVIIDGFFLSTSDLVDDDLWIAYTQHVHALDEHTFDRMTYGHPGTPAVLLAIGARIFFGVSYAAAYLGGMTILIALAIAGCSTVCHLLRPHALWWLVAAFFLIFNRLFLLSTPPTAVVMPLVVLALLLAWYLYEIPAKNNVRSLIVLGTVVGVAGATRTDVSSLLALVLLIFLLPRIGLKSIVLVTVIAAVFVAANPFMLLMPLVHIGDLVDYAYYHYAHYGDQPQQLSLLDIVYISPLAIVGIVTAVIWLALARKLPQPAPAPFILTVLLFTVGVSALLLTARFQAARYFFPLAVVWEVLLPLFLLDGTSQFQFTFAATPATRRLLTRAVYYGMVVFLIGGQAALFLHLYSLPTSRWFLTI